MKYKHKPKKKKSAEEDAAIKYLEAQYDSIVPDQIKTFKDFPLSQKTLKGLKENNFIKPTDIQRQAIGYALQGKDILGAAKTGSGKTLAFLIPMLELLFCKKWTRLDGVGAMVISPTRELAYQIYETLRKVGHLHDFSAGLIIGGQNLKFERKRMDQMNILICTPGRLLQHMDENPLFDCSHLQILVLDEADRCLDMGFEATMNAIIENLPPKRQTLLFSATQTKSVKDLARLSLSFPTYVAPHEQAATVTPEFLQQNYIICKIDEKFSILWSFIKNHLKQKVLVFMSTCKQVKYTYEIFCKLRPGVSLLALYGTLHQEKRERIYQEFCRKSNVVLFATDLASRGLDFPRVNWVIQYDCPEDVETYIHRAGRTARGVMGKGDGLLMLLPHEEKIVEDLQKSKIPINQIFVDTSKVMIPLRKIESLLSDNSELKKTAQRAFMSYIKSIYLMKNKDIFNVQLLDTDAFARSIGLIVPPVVKFMYKQNKSVTENKVTEIENDDIEKLLTKKANDEKSDESDLEADVEPIFEAMETKTKREVPLFDFHNVIVDSDEKNLFIVKGKNVNIDVVVPPDEDDLPQKKIDTPSTKTTVVKKTLDPKVKLNNKVKFGDDGEIVADEKKDIKSDLGKQFVDESVFTLDLEKTRELLEDEDKFDKTRFRKRVKAKHKEQKRKLKNKKKEDDEEKDDFGSQSESDGPDLSWLPDPDKIYGPKDNDQTDDTKSDSEYSENNNSPESMISEDDQEVHRPSKRKQNGDIPQENTKPRKLKKIQDASASLSVNEAEALAMQLLKSK